MRLILIQTAFLGDFVLTTPVIRELSQRFGRENVFIIARPHISQITDKKVIPFDKKKKLKELIKVIMQVWRIKPQMALVPHLSATSAVIPILGGVKEIIGFEENPLSFFFSKKIKKYEEGIIPESKKIARILIPLGMDIGCLEPDIYLDSENLNSWRAIFDKSGKRKIVFAPFSNWGTKTWPWWGEFLNSYSSEDQLIILGEKRIDIPSSKNQSILNLVGKTSLKDAVSIIYLSDLFFGVDNGLSHIASAFKKRCFIIFGPTTPKFGFFPNFSDFVALESVGLGCKPCSSHGPRVCPVKHFRCMMNLTPQVISKFFEDFLRSSS